MEGGRETNYWPGFVDALANVVVTMVFVLVVFVIALLYFAQNKAKAVAGTAVAAARAQRDAPGPHEGPVDVQAMQRRIAALLEENERLRRAMQRPASQEPAAPSPGGGAIRPQAGTVARAELQVVGQAVAAVAASAPTQIRGAQSAIEIVFPGGVTELDRASLERLEAAFAAIGDRAKDGVELVSVPEAGGAYSEGRRLAYYRNLAVRNWLIAHGVAAGAVRMRIADRDTGRSSASLMLSPS